MESLASAGKNAKYAEIMEIKGMTIGLNAHFWSRWTKKGAKKRNQTKRSISRSRLQVESLEDRLMLAAVTVNSAGDFVDADSNVTTLREAIASVNAETNTSIISTIRFAGTALTNPIQIQTALPEITKPVDIDADTSSPFTTKVTIIRTGTFTEPALRLNIPTGTGATLLPIKIGSLQISGFIGNAIQITNLPSGGLLEIRNNVLDNNTGNGLEVTLPSSKFFGNLRVTDNKVTRNSVGIHIVNYKNEIDASFQISGNLVGTDGTSATEGNTSHGIHLVGTSNSSNTSLGIYGNTVGKNGGDGFRFENSNDIYDSISSNKIGIRADGTGKLGNGGDGIYLLQSRFTIELNVIGGNVGDGVEIASSSSVVLRSNGIGTLRSNSETNLGNNGAGVVLSSGVADTKDTTVGGTGSSDGNFIHFNVGGGVTVAGTFTDRNEISRNSFRGNSVPIDLRGLIDRKDMNDHNDSDPGPNDLMNYPEINVSMATFSAGSWLIPFSYDVDVAGSYRFEIYKYNAAAQEYKFVKPETKTDVTIGEDDYQGSFSIPDGSAAANVQAGDRLAVLAVRTAVIDNPPNPNVKNTSEMSPPAAGLVAADTAPPKVTNVVITGRQSGGAAWDSNTNRSFSTLISAGQQFRPIATQGANQIQIQFNEDVRKRNASNQFVSLNGSELVLYRTVRQQASGTNPAVNPYTTPILTQTVSSIGFLYNPTTHLATWTFPTLADGKYAIHLASNAPGAGIYGVTDVAGNALDSTWMMSANKDGNTPDAWQGDPSINFADGDGTPGSDDNRFRLHFAILVGDYNGDGAVDGNDLTVGGDFGTDGNGDGSINSLDITNVRDLHLYNILPLRGVGGADFSATASPNPMDDEYVSGADLAVWRNAFGLTANGDSTGDSQTSGNDLLGRSSALGNKSVWNLTVKPTFSIPGSYGGQPILGLPKVTNVLVSGSISQHTTFSFDTVDGSGAQLTTVPLGGADTIYIAFNESVNISADDLVVVGLRTANLPVLVAFSYDPLSFTAAWRFEGWAVADQYLVAISDDVTDVDGNQLDGEWANPATTTTTNLAVSEFPSGNDEPGGWFKFVMTLLPGDANLDNVVNGLDYSIFSANYGGLLDRLFTQGDFNGNGQVSYVGDGNLLSSNYGYNYQTLLILADFDGDFDVDDADISVIEQHLGMTGATRATGDLNGDGVVTMADLDLAFAQYGLTLNVVS